MKYKFPYLAINDAVGECVLVINYVKGMSNALGPNVIIMYAEMLSLDRVLISYEELKYVYPYK